MDNQVAALTEVCDSQSQYSPTHKVVSGTKIVNGNGTNSVVLFSDANVKSLIGRSFNNQTDCITAMNADVVAALCVVTGCCYNPTYKSVDVYFDRTVTSGQPVRINFTITYKA